MPDLRTELDELLRIPSISTGGGDPAALKAAADWLGERIEAAGGTARQDTIDGGHPIVVGELRASTGGADTPTVLAYGHYDVQDPGDEDAWTSPPFEPTVRDGRIYARGAADDKGNFLPLLHVACEMARTGELPVNVRILVEGEEEIGSRSVLTWLAQDDEPADCAIVFDALMVDEHTPALSIAGRGLIAAGVTVRAAERDLHSGLYGGVALNAAHVLMEVLSAVTPDAEGRVRPELRAGVAPIVAAERESWGRLPAGEAVLSAGGGRPVVPGAAAELYARTGADTALDVNAIALGQPRTIVPATAHAHLTVRLAPGQDGRTIADTVTALIQEAAPAGADVQVEIEAIAEPALFDPEAPALKLAVEAMARACDTPPALVRVGGTLPLLAVLAQRDIPAIVSGFVLPEDALHAPNESYRLESLRLGERAARELYLSLAGLSR
jgi:acetylornithine deacetylase/succinyl-diaminopimelate desuccinylase-like protein